LCIAKQEMATRMGMARSQGQPENRRRQAGFAELSQASRRILSQGLKISSKAC